MIVFKPEDFDGLLSHCPSISRFTRVAGSSQTISYGQKTVEDVQVTGIDPGWHEIENRFVILGRPFSLIDDTQGASRLPDQPRGSRQARARPRLCRAVHLRRRPAVHHHRDSRTPRPGVDVRGQSLISRGSVHPVQRRPASCGGRGSSRSSPPASRPSFPRRPGPS